MADAAAPVVFPEVIANWQRGLRLLASSLRPNIGRGERSSERLETAMTCLGDPLDPVETTSPRI